MTAEDEQLIIDTILAGNTAAFAVLVDHYKDMAVVLAYNIVLNQEDAEEAAQDAFVRACTALHTFKSEARFSTWLYRIVVNTALNRKKIKKHAVVDITEVMDGELEQDTENFDAFLVSADQRRHIQHALRTLHHNERLCITLYYLNELNVAEIHRLTAISISNVKVLLHRGRKNLHAALLKHLKTEITNLIDQP